MPRDPQRHAASQLAFDITFPARVDALPAPRHEFAGWLDDIGVDAGAAQDLAVVFSELTTNAVAGSPDESTPVSARARREGGDVMLDIRNVAADERHHQVQRWDLDDPLREGGRGLLIVRALVDDLDISRDGEQLAVRCRCQAFDGAS